MPRESRESSPRTRQPRERTHHHTTDAKRERRRRARRAKHESASSANSGTGLLSTDALARLDRRNQRESTRRPAEVTPQKKRRKRREVVDEKPVTERREKLVVEKRRDHKKKRRREVSGVLLEEGDGPKLKGLRGGADRYEKSEDEYDDGVRRKRKWLWIGLGVVAIILIIVVAVVVSKKNSGSGSKSSSSTASETGSPSNSNLDGMSESNLPASVQGTVLDPWTWYDTSDFNVTYTAETVGGLSVMGLNSTWDDSAAATSQSPALSDDWGAYADRPARGVNLGGWLSLEPFITPSLFNYPASDSVIDEWTLTTHLGSSAKSTLEKHYATFVSEQTFKDIADAGLDHVRIPFSYWAVTTYDGDPYVAQVSWRYLLRGIEWARKYGLRINLDLHGLPGSQNGWNHSGRQGTIGWLNGTDGDLNAQRSLDIHNQLSTFFAQDRYKNILAFYGLANEPKMTALVVNDVLNWTSSAYTLIKGNGINAYIVFGDGFMGLENWQGKLTGMSNLILDVHQYLIFNKDQIVYNHTEKVNYACNDWTTQTEESMNVATGYGSTIFAEWSQADTDCAPNLNNVNMGNRWTGTFDSPDSSIAVTSPVCPTKNSQCECADANAAASAYSSTYKNFLQMFAEAQMKSFEVGWGWFYWTWVTEDATQWSYQLGLAAGILPAKAYAPDFNCTATIPTYSGLPEYY